MSYLGNEGRFIQDAGWLEDAKQELDAQLHENAYCTGLAVPEFDDDEQWAFPYGRLDATSFALFSTNCGDFVVRFSMTGIVEESSSVQSSILFPDKDGFTFVLQDPSEAQFDMEVGVDAAYDAIERMAGGWSYWMEPRKEGSWADDIFSDGGAELAGIAAESILEQIRYREVMGR